MRINSSLTPWVMGPMLALFFACGGGGGGSSTTAPASPAYQGPTTPAVLTSQGQVTAITGGALVGADAGSIASGASVAGGTGNQLGPADLAQTLTTLGGLAQKPTNPAAGVAFSEVLSGTCGGTGVLSGSISPVVGSRDASGTLTFSNYCVTSSDGLTVVVNGSLGFSMAGTESSYLFTMSTSYLSLTVGGSSYVYALTYTTQVTNGTYGQVTLTADYLTPWGKTYRIENYVVSADTVLHTLSIFGRFYDPDYGYVNVSTPVILTYANCGPAYRPVSGTLQVDGANSTWGQFIGGGCSTYFINVGVGTAFQSYQYYW